MDACLKSLEAVEASVDQLFAVWTLDATPSCRSERASDSLRRDLEGKVVGSGETLVPPRPWPLLESSVASPFLRAGNVTGAFGWEAAVSSFRAANVENTS